MEEGEEEVDFFVIIKKELFRDVVDDWRVFVSLVYFYVVVRVVGLEFFILGLESGGVG